MGLLSNTGLLPSRPKNIAERPVTLQPQPDLKCDVTVTPAPYMLRPYAGLYNPFAKRCSVLCNHPTDNDAKAFVKKVKNSWLHGDGRNLNDDAHNKDNSKIPHDIVTEEMFRRYTETDSRPLTPAPTLASGKSRSSRRCLTPDHPQPRTAIVLDLRRSHSQETLYYHGYATSDLTGGNTSSPTYPSASQSEGPNSRFVKGDCEQLPPLATPYVLLHRTERPAKEPSSVRAKKFLTYQFLKGKPVVMKSRHRFTPKDIPSIPCIPEASAPANTTPARAKKTPDPRARSPVPEMNTRTLPKKNAPAKKTPVPEMNTPGPPKKTPAPPKKTPAPQIKTRVRAVKSKTKSHVSTLTSSSSSSKSWFKTRDVVRVHFAKTRRVRFIPPSGGEASQVKALNLNKGTKGKNKGSGDTPGTQRSKSDKDPDTAEVNDLDLNNDDAGSIERRRGKRRRKGRQSDRLTSAGLAAQTQQDPETQIAGIGTDSHNPSSRGSIAATGEREMPDYQPPAPKPVRPRFMDSFLDDEILRYLHREVDLEAIETEFDTKRRYVFTEALRTRPERNFSQETLSQLNEIKVPAVSLAQWLHIPRVFSRQNAQFSLPLDTRELEGLTPMQYAARYVTVKKSKQLLYLTVLRKFHPDSYRMPKKDIEEGLVLMSGGVIKAEQVKQFRTIMEWDQYEEGDDPTDISITLQKTGIKHYKSEFLTMPWDFFGGTDSIYQLVCEMQEFGTMVAIEKTSLSLDYDSLRFRTWCGLCAICERMYGRFPPRTDDPPDGIELGDFSGVETKLSMLKVHAGLAEILHVIRSR